MPAGIRTSSVITLLAAATFLPATAPAASFVYNFKSTDNSYALEWESPVLLPRDLRFLTVPRSAMNYCTQGGTPCDFAVFSTDFGSLEESFDAIGFGVQTGALFLQTSLTRTGAAVTVGNSPLNGRVVIYRSLDDDLYEYFFKDSTGTRTFTYRTPRPLLSDIDIPLGLLTDCSSPTGPCSSPISIKLDFTFFETFDMLTLTENGVPRIYAFPRLSFNRFGTASTLPGAEQGTLVVRRVRSDGAPAPDDPIDDPPPPPPPSQVPEPATVALAAAGLAALTLRRRVSRALGLLFLGLGTYSAAPAASFVYLYEDTTGIRFQWERARLITGGTHIVPVSALDFCEHRGSPCVADRYLRQLPAVDFVSFLGSGRTDGAQFPSGSFSVIGAALSLPNSAADAKLIAYPHSNDLLWEYYFKDATDQRVFTFRRPRPLVSDIELPIGALTNCTSPTGPCSSPISIDLDVVLFGEFDMLSFLENGVQRVYAFPRLSFSQEGEFQTLPEAQQARLTVRRVRYDRPTVPGDATNPGTQPPSEVPEPATVALAAAGLAVLFLRRRRLPTGVGALALALFACAAAHAGSFVYYYEDTAGSRFQWATPRLLLDDWVELAPSGLDLCQHASGSCSDIGLFPGPGDIVFFDGQPGFALFPGSTLARTGAALTTARSRLDAKLIVYPHSNDLLWEYYFKDATDQRVFTFRRPRPLVSDIDLPIGALTNCTSPNGPCSSPISINLDAVLFGELDMLSFLENGVQRVYAFPRLSFSQEGEFQTLPEAQQASLTVRRVRYDRPTVPGDATNPGSQPPPEVPEPATFVLAAVGLGALAVRRRLRACAKSPIPRPAILTTLPPHS